MGQHSSDKTQVLLLSYSASAVHNIIVLTQGLLSIHLPLQYNSQITQFIVYFLCKVEDLEVFPDILCNNR